MKKTLSITLIFMLSFSTIFSQTIDINDTGGSKSLYSIDGKILNLGELTDIVKDNQVSFELMKSAKSSFVTSRILGYAGGFMIGLPIGSYIGGKKPNWFLAVIGLGVVGVSLAIDGAGSRKVKKSVLNYNKDLDVSSKYQFKPRFYLRSNVNGVGIVMNF